MRHAHGSETIDLWSSMIRFIAFYNHTPAQLSCLGVYWFHSVHPSVRPAFCVCSVAPTVLVGSISYLYILWSNFRRCVLFTSFAKFQNLNFWQFFKICNFDFVFFWLGIWCESQVGVIMGWRRVSQNAGILIVLVRNWIDLWSFVIQIMEVHKQMTCSHLRKHMTPLCKKLLKWYQLF